MGSFVLTQVTEEQLAALFNNCGQVYFVLKNKWKNYGFAIAIANLGQFMFSAKGC